MRSKRSSGFILIELMIALVMIVIVTASGISVLMGYLNNLDEQHAAQQQQQVVEAVEKYLKDNFSTVLANAGATAPAVITVPMLHNTRYLPAGFRDANIYGQQYQVLARKSAASQFKTLIVTTGGQAASELSIRRIAQLMGATGGYILKTNISIAQGTTWQAALSNFGSASGAGHLATALFFRDGATVNGYLYRNTVSGHPELNWMNTTLDMGSNNIAAAGAITASGNITTSADISAHNAAATGTVKADIADVADETYTEGWFRTRGDMGWYNEKWGGGWYTNDSTWVRSWMNENVYTGGKTKAGKLTAEGRTEVGEYLQLKGVAIEGANCTPNGLAGITSTGLWLSCQDGKRGRTAASMRLNTTAGVIKDWRTLHGQGSAMVNYDYARCAITCDGRFCIVDFNQTFDTNYSFGLITEISPGSNHPEPYKTPNSTNVVVTCVN